MKLTPCKLKEIVREELLKEQDETVMRFTGIGEDSIGSRGIVVRFHLESGDRLLPGDERIERLLQTVDQFSGRNEAYVEGRRIDVLWGKNSISRKRLARLIRNSPYTI